MGGSTKGHFNLHPKALDMKNSISSIPSTILRSLVYNLRKGFGYIKLYMSLFKSILARKEQTTLPTKHVNCSDLRLGLPIISSARFTRKCKKTILVKTARMQYSSTNPFPIEPMPTYKSFAIAGGAGNLGSHILNAFLSVGVNPLVLTRKTSTSVSTFPPSLPVAKIDYENIDEIARVLKEHNVEVIVSAISTFPLTSQYVLVDAAKKAGVKLFVPSEFGAVTDGISHFPGEDGSSALCEKDKVAEYLKAIGLPYARFFTGVFLSFVPMLTGHAENGKVNIVGKGEASFSFTDLDDIGGYVAHVLSSLPPVDLANRCFRIEGGSTTFIDIAKRLQKEVQYLDHFPGQDPLSEIVNYLLIQIDNGRGSVNWDYNINARRRGEGAIDNRLWAGHKWKTLADISL